MTSLKMQVRRALFISLRYYQRSIKPAELVKLYRVPADIWKILIQHGDLEIVNNSWVRLSDQGLATAKKMFPAMKSQLNSMQRVTSIELLKGYVFLTRVEVNKTQVIAHYLDNDGNDVTDINDALFVPAENWRRKKSLERQYQQKMVLMAKTVDYNNMDDDVQLSTSQQLRSLFNR